MHLPTLSAKNVNIQLEPAVYPQSRGNQMKSLTHTDRPTNSFWWA
jgi:hypothetical protein